MKRIFLEKIGIGYHEYALDRTMGYGGLLFHPLEEKIRCKVNKGFNKIKMRIKYNE